MNLLKIKNLSAIVDDKQILNSLNLTINSGEIHVIMGPNGAGKSTLAYTLMGHPKYELTNGEVEFLGENLMDMKVDERARRGLFLSFQYPEVIPGVTVENFLRTAKTSISGNKQSVIGFRREITQKMKELNIDEAYSQRYLNQGFSGGEKKKNEILQMLILDPKLVILDETDSGLDVDAIKTVAQGVKTFANENNGVLIITHYNKLLTYVEPDYVHILVDGKIVASGDRTLADTIDKEGFETFIAASVSG